VEPFDIKGTYISALLQKAELCNNRFHQIGFWFAGIASIGYFLSNSEATSLSILGASVAIPRAVLIGATPPVLAALFYSISCFAALEAEYYKEIRKFFGTVQPNGEVLSQFQVKLLEAPSHYTYDELRDIAGTAPAFSRAGSFATYLTLFIYGLVPVIVIGYFLIVSFRTFGVSWVLVVEGLALFLGLFGFLQFFENLGRGSTR
jgi:hypothetical protein